MRGRRGDGEIHRGTQLDATKRHGHAGRRQINPTSWNFASTMSLSNGFMMYSLAPACSARAICATSFSVVQNTTFGRRRPASAAAPQEVVAVHLRHVPVEQDRVRQALLAGFQRLLAVLGLDDLEIKAFENSPRHLADDAGIINDQTGFHRTLAIHFAASAVAYATIVTAFASAAFAAASCRARARHREQPAAACPADARRRERARARHRD